jgi:hypothetical protein
VSPATGVAGHRCHNHLATVATLPICGEVVADACLVWEIIIGIASQERRMVSAATIAALVVFARALRLGCRCDGLIIDKVDARCPLHELRLEIYFIPCAEENRLLLSLYRCNFIFLFSKADPSAHNYRLFT